MTDTPTTEIESIIGRDDMHDLDSILSMTNTEVDELVHSVTDNCDAVFTWDYEKGARPQLDKLYEKAKVSQWNGSTDLDWSIEVDPDDVLLSSIVGAQGGEMTSTVDVSGTPFETWGDAEWRRLGKEMSVFTLSNFMHGEQGALICTAKICETVPWIDAKYYAATQVMDEARHVEVFARYLDEKIGDQYPINVHLRMLLDDIIDDSRWDMTYLGMQVMVEGLALAAFGFLKQLTTDPLLEKLLRYVMSDEARHVAFGVLSLREFYEELSDAEMKDRQEFAFEAAVRMKDRILQQEVWERLEVDPKIAIPLMMQTPEQQMFQQMLFSKIVPNCKKLGLLERNDGWLRTKFTELGVIQFEDWTDTGEEYELLDEVAADRAGA